MKKTLRRLLVLSSLFFTTNLMAQTNNYTAEWKKIEQFIQNGLPKSALEEINKIMKLAIAHKNQPQQVKAAMYQLLYRRLVEEDAFEKNIYYLDTLISNTAPPAKNILQSIQAEFYWGYKQANRYKLYNRTALEGENSKDISTWSLQKLNQKTADLYQASLHPEDLLKKADAALYQAKTNGRNNSVLAD